MAEESCEQAFVTQYELGFQNHYQHSVTGDFDPSFTDTIRVNWPGTGTNYPAGQYKATCTGRYDDSHQFANVLSGTATRVGNCDGHCP